MENYPHSSHPDSLDSSPRSREVENENTSFDEPPPSNTTYKVKLVCSYGGKIQPRPHDNQLAYVGGDTKIIAVDRNIKFSAIMAKLSALINADVCFKYQLPGEELDNLISLINEEDLDHMMDEYDRLCRASPKPARLRLFLFPLNNASSAPKIDLEPTESKPEQQWFVDALNSVQNIPPLEGSSPPPPMQPANPDFLFGLDNAYPAVPAAKAQEFAETVPTVPEIAAGSECGSEDPQAVREPEIQEQQWLQIGNNEQLLQRKIEEENSRVYGVDCYPQKNTENVAPLMAHAHAHAHAHAQVNSGPVPLTVPGPVSVQASFLQERHNQGGGYSEQQPVYLIQTPSGIYQAVRPVTGPMGQPVYLIQTPVSLPHSLSHSANNIAYNGSEVGGVSERGYSQVAYLPERSALRRQAAAAPGGEGWN